MKREVLQFDLVNFDASKIQVTPQGFLRIGAHFTGVGVYPYLDATKPGKIVRRLRRETEVFKPESMKTLEDAPYTKRHPPKMVDPSNVSMYRKGHVSGSVVKIGSKLLGGEVIIEDADAIEDVKNGVKQLSCGYLATIDDTGGIWHDPELNQDFPYDDEQIDIVYNHVAGVPLGRQGPDKTLLVDRKEFYFQDGLDFDMPQGDENMIRKFMIDGKEFSVEIADDASFNAIHKAIGKIHDDCSEMKSKLRDAHASMDDFKEKMEKSESEKKEAKDAADKITAQLDTLNKEVERLKKVQVDSADPKNLLKVAKDRLLKVAVLNSLTDGAKLSFEDSAEFTDADIMRKVVIADAALDVPKEKQADEMKKVTAELKDKSEVYIQAAYDAIERREKKSLQQNIDLGTFIIDKRELSGRQGKNQEDGLNPELRTTGRTTPKTKVRDEEMSAEDKKKMDDDKSYRDKQESRFKDYKGAKSKDTMEKKVR